MENCVLDRVEEVSAQVIPVTPEESFEAGLNADCTHLH